MSMLAHAFRNAMIVAGFLLTLEGDRPVARAEGWSLTLAQASPPALPPNVAVQQRSYVVEGIVVVVLFAGAVFAVCRSSGRS